MSAVLEQLAAPTTPGLYPNVPAEEYHRWPHVSQSRLKVLRDKSPAHLRHEMDNPPEPTPAMVLGTAVHLAVLQPDLFRTEYVKAPDVDRRTKAGKALWAEYAAEWGEDRMLRADDYDLCLAMRDAVYTHPVARKLLDGASAREQSAVWVDPTTGLTCKGRFDAVCEDTGAIVELKTTSDASPTVFPRSIYRYGYYIQGAHYLSGAQTLGIKVDLFPIIAVESEPPHCVAVYQVEDLAIKAGLDELRPLMETYARCQESGVWPGYDTKAVTISLPAWAWFEINERTGFND